MADREMLELAAEADGVEQGAEHKVSIPVDNELAIAITIECLRSTYLDAKSLRPGFVDPKDLKAFRRVLRWFGEAASDLESRNNNDRGKQNAS